jgi:hypothetical protein
MAIIFPMDAALDSDLFSFKDNMFVSEASTVRGPRHYRIYDDAADVGIAIKSSRTGTIIIFHLIGQTVDRDGDMIAEIYGPIPAHVKKYHLARNMTIKIFND